MLPAPTMPLTPPPAVIFGRPRRWRRWVLGVSLLLSTIGATAWVMRDHWLGPLVARTVVKTLQQELGGRWQVDHVGGSFVSSIHAVGLTCVEAPAHSVVPQCRIGSITVVYSWWRFFGSAPLTAIDVLTINDAAVTIDSTAITRKPDTTAMAVLPWTAAVAATGSVTVITAGGNVEAPGLQLHGELAHLHLESPARLAGQPLGSLQIDAQHTGASPADGWVVNSHLYAADEIPLEFTLKVASAMPALSATVAAGEGTRMTCHQDAAGMVFSGNLNMERVAPALRRVVTALGATLPSRGVVSADGQLADNGTLILDHAGLTQPGITVTLSEARWNATRGLIKVGAMQAQIRPTQLYPALAEHVGEVAAIEINLHASDGMITAQLTSHDLPATLTARAQVAGQIATSAWRSAQVQVELDAATAATAAERYQAHGIVSGSCEMLTGSLEVEATRLLAGTWQGEQITASAQMNWSSARAHQGHLDGEWKLGATAIRHGAQNAPWTLASSGHVHADDTGLRLDADTAAPLVAHAALSHAAPCTADGAWLTALVTTPVDGQWQVSDIDLAHLAPLLTDGVHLDGHASGHGDLIDVLHAVRWSAALVVEKANLGGLPPLPPLLDINAAITANPEGITFSSLHARAGGGHLEISGSLPFPKQPGPLALTVIGHDALIFQRPDVRLRADAEVHLNGTWAAPELKGKIHLTDLVATTPVSWFGGRDLPAAESPFEGLNALPAPWSQMQLDLHLSGGQDAQKSLEIRNNVLVASLAIDVTVGGKAALPVASGEIRCRSGRLVLPFSAYRIDSAALRFNPADPYDPVIDASASTQMQGYMLIVQITGTLRHPHIDVSSSPPLAPEDALVLASTGRLPAELRRDGTSASAIGVALPFVGRELRRWVVGDGFADDSDSLLDRFVVRYDEDRSERGLPSIRLEYQLYGPWYLYGERDRHEAYNQGLMWRWIFSDPARLRNVRTGADESDEEPVGGPAAAWRVVPAPGVARLPVSARKLLATVPARQRLGADANQPAQIASAAQRMVDRLHEAGYPDARVQPMLATIPDDSVQFEVTPGLPWTISSSQVHGAPAEFAATLQTILASGLPAGTAPTPSQKTATRTALRSALINAGYALAQVRIDIHRDPQAELGAIVQVTIKPGLHYRFASEAPRIDGTLPAALGQRLTDTCLAMHGKEWTRRQVIALRGQLLELLHLEGYAFAQVVLTDDEPGLLPDVACSIRITPGDPVILHAIKLSGFHSTSENYVLRRLQLTPGAVLRDGEPSAALARLRRSGVARSLQSTVTPIGVVLPGMPVAQQPADLSIVAEEAPPRSVELTVGYGSYEGARGSALFRDTNVFGWGRTWEIGGEKSQRSYGGHTRVIDHDLLGIQRILSITLAGGWRQEPSFNRTTYASETSVRAPLTSWLDLRTAYTLEAERASERAADVDTSQDQGFVVNGVLNTHLLWDGRDDRQLPTRGGLAEIGFGISDPTLGSQLSYIEWSARLGWVVPVIDDRLIWATQVAGTVRRTTDGNQTLPIQYRLFLGGSTTVRSFGLNELSPISADGEALGGLTASYANVELRAKVAGDFHVAAFYDVGKVSEHSWTLDGALGQAIGGGLRYHLPIGPLRLDAAYNPGEQWAATKSYAFEAAIGFTF